ncbi:Conserved_hypothetical protein [Hexamita inflata]|uniref:Uncharacterized protein n=1 Tax=Hexamita inflata TaxID=28002 RepID=A0AA86TNP8_9EUKA|nr:Conserved hypothetical protein [Hexamita inflata]
MNSRIDSFLFADAIQQCLHYYNIHVENDAIKIYNALQSININEKQGIWRNVATILQIEHSAAHNYYHNTWSTQFYTNIKPYRPIIKKIILNNPDVEQKELVQHIMNLYPDQKFSKHNLQQVVYIQKQRALNHKNNIGFSIPIQMCIRYQDAIQQ